MKMRNWLLGGALALGVAGVALAQPGTIIIKSLVGNFSLPIVAGPTSAKIFLSGGTFVCAAGTATVANTRTDAGSLVLLTLKTVGGTVAAPFVATITAGTGFTVTCGGSDTSTYNYAILG